MKYPYIQVAPENKRTAYLHQSRSAVAKITPIELFLENDTLYARIPRWTVCKAYL